MKIYIMGSTGSGKTTFARNLSCKYGIEYYELDKIVWDDDNGNIKRTDGEIEKLFQAILRKDDWIIEDVGRSKFIKGREEADRIYYIKISRIKAYFRVVKRWLYQKIGIEDYNYPPTINHLFDMLRITKNYFKKEKSKIDSLEIYKEKVIFLGKKELRKILK